MGKFLLIIGLLGLCHAAYSAAQHRLYLRLTEQEFSRLPADIIIQSIGSLIVCGLGVLNIVSKFKQIRIKSEWENKTWDNIASRASFYTFNHRGRYTYTNARNLKQELFGKVEDIGAGSDHSHDEDDDSDLSSLNEDDQQTVLGNEIKNKNV
jgi:hypothetical protein